MRGDGALVGVDLAEQERLDEAPRGHEGMAIVQRRPERERLQHVAFEIDVSLQVGLGDVALIQRTQRFQRAIVTQPDAKLGLALADLPLLSTRKLDREGRGTSADTVEKGVESGYG